MTHGLTPTTTKRQHRKVSSTPSSSHLSSPTTSSTSTADSQTSSATPRQGESSATSALEFVEEAPPLRAFRKKRKSSVGHHGSEQAEPEVHRYWNEYGNPDSGDEGYYIYIDPDALVKFPRQELFEGWAAKTRRLFNIKEVPEEEGSVSSAESSDDDSNDSPINATSGYGTFASPNTAPQHEGYFDSLFRTSRDPQRDIEALNIIYHENGHQSRTLLNMRQHKAETMKLNFYTTWMVMAIVIDILLGMMTMTMTSRKERGVVDTVVLLGTVCNLLLGVIAIISMQARRENLGQAHRGLVYAVFTANVVVDVLFFIWVFKGFGNGA